MAVKRSEHPPFGIRIQIIVTWQRRSNFILQLLPKIAYMKKNCKLISFYLIWVFQQNNWLLPWQKYMDKGEPAVSAGAAKTKYNYNSTSFFQKKNDSIQSYVNKLNSYIWITGFVYWSRVPTNVQAQGKDALSIIAAIHGKIWRPKFSLSK